MIKTQNFIKKIFSVDKNLEDLSRWDIYCSIMEVCAVRCSPETREFLALLNVISKYMLNDRFIKVDPKIKSKVRIRDDDGFSLKPKLDTDLLRYDGIKLKNPETPLNPLDTVKFYKGLENFVLSNKLNTDYKALKLGQFSKFADMIVDSLTKLLLSISSYPNDEKRRNLSALFSGIVIYRQFKVKSIPNTETLTKEYNGWSKDIVNVMFSDQAMQEWILENFSNKDLNKEINLKFYSGNASSPNSLSSTSKTLEDAWSVKNDPSLWKSIQDLASQFNGGEQFIYFVKVLFENIWDMPAAIHSRLFHFTAPGGKARIIANVDWISQSALSGMHYYFFSLLSNLRSDQTFDHKGGIKKIYSGKTSYYSVDLSAATDRVPRWLEQRLIKNIFDARNQDGKLISESWENIMNREYHVGDSPMNNGKPIRYAVGQGMGLFTSWSSMALLHHFIVNKLCNIPLDNYVLVGDDLVIKGDRIYFDRYLEIMSAIGVEVNLSKTLVSEESEPTIEFARNYVIRGEFIQPIQFGLLFAWADEKASLETFLFASDWITDWYCMKTFLMVFKRFLTIKRIMYILYSDFKNGSNLCHASICSTLELPKWVRDVDWNKIYQITKTKGSSPKPLVILEDLSPLSTLKSQLVVRTKEDMIKVLQLSERIATLAHVDEEVAKTANELFNRMNSVQLLQYDVGQLGNPLISLREMKLISKIADREIAKSQKR